MRQKKISVLDFNGELLYEISANYDGVGGLSNPVYMTNDDYDNLFILDKEKQEIVKYSSEGLFRGVGVVVNPIALTVDRSQKIHILRKDENNNYMISIYSQGLKVINEVRLSNLFNPVDIVINQFGEYYVVDREQGNVFRYGKFGNVIGDPIGKKSTSKGKGQFSTPVSLVYNYLNNEDEEIYVLDSKFSLIQNFVITTLHEREKIKPEEPFLPITSNLTISDIKFESFYANSNYRFFLRENNSLLVKNDDADLYIIEGSQFNNVKSIEVSDEFIYVGDSGSDKVFQYDINTGKLVREITQNISELIDIAVDDSGLLYVAEEKDVKVFNSKGEYISSFFNDKILFSGNILELTGAGSFIFMRLENDPYYYVFDSSNKSLSQNSIEFTGFGSEKVVFAPTNQQIVFIYNDERGTVGIFDEGVKTGEFISRGSLSLQMNNADGMFYDSRSSQLLFVNKEYNVIKVFNLKLPSGMKLELEVDDLGFAKLTWQSDAANIRSYRIYRRSGSNQEFQLLTEVNETQFTILEEVNTPYEYEVRAVNTKGEAETSNSIVDRFTFARSIRYNRPEEAIDIMMEQRELNENVVENQILSIYRELVNKNKQDNKLELALRNISKMKMLKPHNFAFYLERSEILEKLKRYSDAIDELEVAKSKFPSNVSIYYHLIDTYKRQGNYRKVIAVSNEALANFSNDEKILTNLADAYYQLKIFNESARYYRALYQQTGMKNTRLKPAEYL